MAAWVSSSRARQLCNAATKRCLFTQKRNVEKDGVDKVDPCNAARLKALMELLQNLTLFLHSVVPNPCYCYPYHSVDVDYDAACTGDEEPRSSFS